MQSLKKFFRISKPDVAAALKANEDSFRQMAMDALQQTEDAEKIPDAGEKHQDFSRIEKMIDDYKKTITDVTYGSKKALLTPSLRHARVAAGFTIFAVGAAAFFLPLVITAPVMIMSCLGMAFGGAVLASASRAWGLGRHAKPFGNQCAMFTDALNGLQEKVGRSKQAIVQNELPGLAASKNFRELYDSVPGIRDAFAKAVARGELGASITPAMDPPALQNDITIHKPVVFRAKV